MNRIKKIFILLVLALMASGCVKSESQTEIQKDGSMNFSGRILINKTHSTKDIDITKLNDLGYNVKSVTDGDYVGYDIKKDFDNISSLKKSSDDIDIYDLLYENYKVFNIKKTLLKNKYEVVLKNDKINDLIKNNETATINSNVDEIESVDTANDIDEDNSVIYVVKLPVKSSSNNATDVSNDGKTLTYDLLSVKEVKYSFELYNYTNIIILSGILVFIIILIIVLIIIRKKKMGSLIAKDGLILKEYDPSIEDKLNSMPKMENYEIDSKGQDIIPEEKNTNEVKNVVPESKFLQEKNDVDEFVDL